MVSTYNKSPITPELCHSARLVFYPKDAPEAIYIQKKLFDMGCRWNKSGTEITEVENCIAKGILCDSGRLYYNPDQSTPFLVCSSSQFDPDYLTPDQAYVRDRFNELSARIDDLAEKVNRIHDALFPDMDKTKPRLNKPRGTPNP